MLVTTLSLAVPVIAAPPADAASAAASVPDSAPDEATAARFAHAANKRVLVSSRTTEQEQTFANPDGSWTYQQYAQPVRVRQNSTWVPVDTTLIRRADGSVAPKATVVDLALSGGGVGSRARGPMVRMATHGAEVGLGWAADLPVPSLSGDTATYHDVLAGVDIQVTAQVEGFRENLVIRTRDAARNPALATIAFGSYTKNTTVSVAKGAGAGMSTAATGAHLPADGLAVRDSAGATVFSGDASRMWDSSGAGSAVDKRAGQAAGQRQAVMGVLAGSVGVTVTPDQGFLADPATNYPVYVDPDYFCSNTAWCGLQDYAVTQQAFPDASNANRGKLSDLKSGYDAYGASGTGSDATGINRSFVQMNVAPMIGKIIHWARLNTHVTHTACSSGTLQTDLYHVNRAVDDNITWNNQPGIDVAIDTINVADHQDADIPVSFVADSIVRTAAAQGWSIMPMELLAEYSQQTNSCSWRRFSTNVYLEVDYDSYPNTPTGLAEQNGAVGCTQGAGRPWVFTRTPELQGAVSDPDGGTLDVAFGLDQGTVGNLVPGTHKTNNATTVVGTPGPNLAATAQFTVPTGWIPQDGTYTWLMSASDTELWSPNSVSCEFTVDSAVPLAPSIRMTGTAPVHQGDNASFSVAVGMATAGFYDIDHFIYTTDGSEPQPQGSPSVAAMQGTISGGGPIATANLTVSAVNGNQNYIKIRAVNKAGTPGPDATCVTSGSGSALDGGSCSYHVLPVTASTGLAGAWGFDEMGGRNLSDTANTTPGNSGPAAHPAGLIGNGNWVPGYDHGNSWTHPDAAGYSDGTKGALTLDGSTAYAETNGPVLDTSKSFSVAAWARLADTTTSHAVLSQDGNQASGFSLQYSPDVNAWTFGMATADQANAGTVRATSTSPPQLNVWTHLVGSYDGTTGQLTLYVNGVEQNTAVATGWASAGFLVMGAAKWNGLRANYLPGQLDDVQVWQRVLSGPEAHDLANAATPLARYGLAEGCAPALTATQNNAVPTLGGYWAFDDGSGAAAHDASIAGNDATLTGGYTWTTGHTGGAIHLDGSTGYGSTAVSAVDTSKSFTVSAWAKPDDLNGYYAVMTQHGSRQDGFQIRYSMDVHRWIFGMTSSDDNTTDNYQWAVGATVPQAGVWTLVTGVYDGSAGQIRLYLNGRLDASRSVTTTWNASAGLAVGAAVGGLNLFKGSIDQVQAWGQVLTDDQIAALAGNTYFDAVSGTAATGSGGITLGAEPDANGNPTGCAARFDNSWSGQADGTRPANLRTDRSYTVEAWVYHSWTSADVAASGAVDPHARAAVGVSDTQFSPVLLGYRPWNDANGVAHGKWSLLVSCSASQPCGWFALSDGDAANNTWTHLAATYDPSTGTIALYVNGVKQNTFGSNGTPSGSGVAGWNGTGDLFIGRGIWTGQRSDEWYGGLAGVRVYGGIRQSAAINADRAADDPGSLFGNPHV